MAYIQRIITLEAEFHICADNEQARNPVEFAAKWRMFIDNWTLPMRTEIKSIQDTMHDEERTSENDD